MKKNSLRILALLLAVCLLTGCGASQVPEDTMTDEVQENQFTFGTLPTVGINWDEMYDDDGLTPPDTDQTDIALETYTLLTGSDKVYNDKDPVRYVMIYNPAVWDAAYPMLNTPLSTGNLGLQVAVDLDKGGLDTPTQYIGASQDQLNKDIPFDQFAQEGSRAGTIITPYQVGDEEIFYCYDTVSIDNARIARYFTCRYAGQYCNVWVADSDMSDTLVQDYGNQFDTYIYQSVVDTFGQPRFANNGGKVNLLYYPMPAGIGGCFSYWDLYAFDEVTLNDITTYGLNTDHAILHINADYTAYPEMQTFMRSTMAHEFQHLICATNTFETLNFNICDTWLNEAMSGYIEEQLYPGVKEGAGGHMTAFREGEFIRNGQSLYNFNSTTEDFGVYGSVYLYSEFLAGLAGSDVFSNVHNYWRTSYSPTLCTAEALANAVSDEVYAAVDRSVPYPMSMEFYSEEERWMSKLTLQYYLELLDQDATDPAAFAQVNGSDLLYNQITAANIEGGGRIIIALEGDTFYIPEDADPGLIYVGLNENFEVVTSLIYS